MLEELEQALGSPLDSQPQVPSPKPLVLVISGPSGVGKDAVIKRLHEVQKEPHEVEGVDYYFVSKAEFMDLIACNELLEHAVVYGDYKGIPKKEPAYYILMFSQYNVQGAATVRKLLGQDTVFIFMVAESEMALVKRLVERKTESFDKLLIRIATAHKEVELMTGAEKTVSKICSIIDAEKARVHQHCAQL
ncbi:hypothetical protein CY35_14G024900 [Sphagnum magellanicum]|nr:hypothetical protein CY35_14G024900 [Sphagnum magellanicum]